MDAQAIGKRLREAIGDGSIRQFARDMAELGEERGIRGVSYAMIHRYLAGEATPSIDFLEGASEELGVRVAWLALGEGERTLAEASLIPRADAARLTEIERRLWDEVAIRIAGHSEDHHAVAQSLYAAVRRLVASLPPTEPSPSPDDVVKIAGLLVDLIQEPLRRLMHIPPVPGSRWFTNYHLAAIYALMLAMPARGSVESVERLIEELEGGRNG